MVKLDNTRLGSKEQSNVGICISSNSIFPAVFQLESSQEKNLNVYLVVDHCNSELILPVQDIMKVVLMVGGHTACQALM